MTLVHAWALLTTEKILYSLSSSSHNLKLSIVKSRVRVCYHDTFVALSSQVKTTTDQNAHQIRVRPYHQAFLQLRICCFVPNKHPPHGHCDLQRVENTVSFLVRDHSRCTKIRSFKAQGGRLRVNTQDMQNWRTTHFKTWLSSTNHFYMKYSRVSRRRTSFWPAASNVRLRVMSVL